MKDDDASGEYVIDALLYYNLFSMTSKRSIRRQSLIALFAGTQQVGITLHTKGRPA
jgi:hypothetical protein